MESIVVIAGAGVAASVGLPALTGPNSQAAQEQHGRILSSKEYGNFLPEMWSFARQSALAALQVPISPLHIALAEKQWPIITQNIGGIHRHSGSENVVEVYGTLFQSRCIRCQHEAPMTAECYQNLEDGSVPPCLGCGRERTRPDICLPGEGMRHRKQAERLLRAATTVVYIGVEEGSGPVTEWHKQVPYSVFVGKEKWGAFSRYFDVDYVDWAEAGLPVH